VELLSSYKIVEVCNSREEEQQEQQKHEEGFENKVAAIRRTAFAAQRG